jgi:hypothetical protein
MDKFKKELSSLIGDTIILFQRYEYTFKSLLTLSLIEGTTESLKNNLNNRRENISKKSLGQLVRQYLEELVDPNESSGTSDTEVKSVHLKMRFSIETLQTSKADIEAKYKTFVEDRNFIVHHLISELVPGDESSYRVMIAKLSDINEKFEKDLQSLIQTRQMIIDGYKHILNSDEMKLLTKER